MKVSPWFYRHFTVKKHRPRWFHAKTRCACCTCIIKDGSQLGNITLRFKHSLYHVLRDFVCFQRVSRFYIDIIFFQNMSTKFISLRVSLKIAILPVKISSFPKYPRFNGHNFWFFIQGTLTLTILENNKNQSKKYILACLNYIKIFLIIIYPQTWKNFPTLNNSHFQK